MEAREAREQFNKGVTALRNGHFFLAQTCFERSLERLDTPDTSSYIAYCRAAGRNEIDQALTTVRTNLHRQPDNPLHYLLLGRIFLLAGQRREALDILRQGARLEPTEEIIHELESFGTRKSPIFPGLGRSNPLNRFGGLVLARVGLR